MPTKQTPGKKMACTCGKCNCRKHHCPVHFSVTSHLIGDKTLKASYMPKTDYELSFRPILENCRPSPKIPPRVIHALPPSVRHDLVTISRQEYIQHPRQPKTHSFKPSDMAFSSDAKLQGSTSYTTDYPPREMDRISRPANRVLQSTIQHNPEVLIHDSYVTTSGETLKKWPGLHCPVPYSEPVHVSFFQGKFDGRTIFRNDFNKDVALQGRPSTSFKKKQQSHLSGGEFNSNTTNKSVYTLPEIAARSAVYLRKASKKNRETMEPAHGKVEGVTQYKTDHPGFYRLPVRLSACEPAPDTLQLFRGHRRLTTENRANYNPRLLKDAPRPRTSYKKLHQRHTIGGDFDDRTSVKVHFQPITLEQLLAQSLVDRQAVAIGHAHKAGAQAKQAQDHGERVSNETTNNTDYQLWNITPRVRYGDKYARAYVPSTKPFSKHSEAMANYVPLKVKPSESCKPLDTRFHGDSRQLPQVLTGKSVYSEEFLPKPFPSKEKCPAELILG